MVGLVGSGSEDRTGQQDQEIHMSARMVERGGKSGCTDAGVGERQEYAGAPRQEVKDT